LIAPLALWACTGDGNADSTSESGSTGTAETSGTPEESGENNGDGDGDTGDGDGDSGDGDGDSGDGDGDSGDGDGDGEPNCAPQDAKGDGLCDQFFGWAWDGMQCVGVSGCECMGLDCNAIPFDLDECEAAHADCGGQPDGCAELDLAACQNNNSCMPINGAKLGQSNQGQCMEPSAFLACTDSMLCAEVLTWGCDINATKYLFFNSCLPDGFMACDGPNLDPPPC
jgi:hypothetical protein